MFNKKNFIRLLISNQGISFFDTSAKGKYSGKPATVYFNWRTVLEDTYNLEKCAKYVIDYMCEKRINADCFVGVPEGATKLAVLLQYLWAKKSGMLKKSSDTSVIIRGKIKEHGVAKDREFLGVPKGDIILIEDIIYRGGAIMDALNKLKKIDALPKAIIVLSDRTNPEYKNKINNYLLKHNIKFYAITSEKEVIKEAVTLLRPSDNIIRKLKSAGKLD